MVQVSVDAHIPCAQIVLRPNQSWTWRANLVLLGTLATLSLAIAMGFLIHGMWLILPFTVLELMAIYFCLHYLVRRNQCQEVITFSADEVVIERGRVAAEEAHRYNRYWAHFCVIAPVLPGRDKRIAIRSHGRELEIGSFLSAADKQTLVERLRDIVLALQPISAAFNATINTTINAPINAGTRSD